MQLLKSVDLGHVVAGESAVVMDRATVGSYCELVIGVFYSPPDRKEQLDCEMIEQIKNAVKEPER